MSQPSVEQRLTHLESRVAELQAELRAAPRRTKDWRLAIGAFTDDAGMLQILNDAMALREADRKKTRVKATKKVKRKPSR